MPGPIQVLRGGGGRLIVRLPFTPERLEKIRTLPGRRWHPAERYWSVEDTPEMPAALVTLFADESVELEGALRPKPLSLIEKFHLAAKARGLRPSTESSYLHWVVRFLITVTDAERVGEADVGRFIGALSSEVGASTQNQALHALLFLFKAVLGKDLGRSKGVVRAKVPVRLPVVLSREEARRVLEHMSGPPRLMALLLYGSGLRVQECCELRVKDIDWAENRIFVRGVKDRDTVLPIRLQSELRRHLVEVRRQHQADLAEGLGAAALPESVRSDDLRSSTQWGWQWVFPATSHYVDATTGQRRRHHLHQTVLQKAFKIARLRAGILKPATCQSLRQSFATHMLEDGYDVRTVQELLGHKSVKSTLAYENVLNRRGGMTWSPAEGVGEGGEKITPPESRKLP